jgi:hypothetical protein
MSSHTGETKLRLAIALTVAALGAAIALPSTALAADTTKPEIRWYTGAWENIFGPSLVISAEVTDDSGARPTTTVNGIPVPAADWHGTRFDYPYTFPTFGVNPVDVVAVDGAGNRAELSVTYHVLDPAVPKLSGVVINRKRVRFRAGRAGYLQTEVFAGTNGRWVSKTATRPGFCATPNHNVPTTKRKCLIYYSVGVRLAAIKSGLNTVPLPRDAVPSGRQGRGRYLVSLRTSVTKEFVPIFDNQGALKLRTRPLVVR